MKKLFVGLFIALAAVTSQAEYLWWTVSQSDMDNGGEKSTSSYLSALKDKGTISGYNDVYANIVVLDSKGEKVTDYSQGFTSEWNTGNTTAVSMKELLGDNYSSKESYTYYVEIASSKVTYGPISSQKANAMTYQQLADGNSLTDSLTPSQTVTAWHGGSGSYAPTPEPTSAMLMLLGVAGLALKRKQKKA